MAVPSQLGTCQDREPAVPVTPGFTLVGAGSGLFTTTGPAASRLRGTTLEPYRCMLINDGVDE